MITKDENSCILFSRLKLITNNFYTLISRKIDTIFINYLCVKYKNRKKHLFLVVRYIHTYVSVKELSGLDQGLLCSRFPIFRLSLKTDQDCYLMLPSNLNSLFSSLICFGPNLRISPHQSSGVCKAN